MNQDREEVAEARRTRLYQRPKSFWSSSPMNSCLQNILFIDLHILFNIHIKTS